MSCSTMPSAYSSELGPARFLCSFLDVCPEVHPSAVPPAKEWFACRFVLALNEINGGRQRFLVDSFHPLLGERTSVFDRPGNRPH